MDNATFQANIEKLSKLFNLDPNRIEFEDLRQMMLFSLSQKQNVIGFMEADSIVFLVDAIASLGAYTQYSIDAAWGEAFIQSARLDDSIRALVRTLGVRQKRKSPTYFTASLLRPDGLIGTMTIVPFTKFTVGSNSFFNREPIVIQMSDTTVDVVLHEGYEVVKQVKGIAGNYVRYMTDDDKFTVSDDDVRLFVNSSAIEVVKNPIWQYRVDEEPIYVVEDFTTATGRLELRFGNNNFAFGLKTSDILYMSYFVTKGSGGRTITTMNQDVSCNVGGTSVKGTGISNVSGGSNEVSADTYRTIGPLAFSSQNRAIDANGYKSVPFEFSGVVDCLSVRQAEYAPEDIRYANFIRMSLLLEDGIDDTKWNNFKAFMVENGLATAKYLRIDPVPVVTDIEADIFIQATAQPSVVNARVLAALTKLFAAKKGSLGLTIAKSDIIETMTTATPNINYVSIISPKYDLATAVKTQKPPTAEAITGALGEGQWQFYVTFTPLHFDAGSDECLPYHFVPSDSGYVGALDTKGYRLFLPTWSLRGATVKLYSRFDNGTTVVVRKVYDGIPTDAVYESGLQVDVTTTTTGTVEAGGLNLVDESGIYYNTLGTVVLNIYTTDRQQLTYRNGL